METSRAQVSTQELEFDTLNLVEAFRRLADQADHLLARGEGLCRDWDMVTAEKQVCDWGQARGELALSCELSDWVERARHLTEAPVEAVGAVEGGYAAASSFVGDHGPGYFLG